MQHLETIEVGIEEIVDRRHGIGDPALTHLEHERLGVIDGLADVVGQAVAQLGDLAGHADEPTQQGVFLDDGGVASGIRDSRCCCLQRDEGGRTADGLEQPCPAQFFGDGDRIGGLTGGIERGDRLIDMPMSRLVEVLGHELLGRHRDGILGQQHGAEQ